MKTTTEKKRLLKQYKEKLSELEAKTDSFPDLVGFTVDFAREHKLTGDDMESVIPRDILECCVPSVLDMIDMPEGVELE